jgi:hypothetical protein
VLHVPIEVIATRRAQQQIAALDRTYTRTFAAFLDDLSLNGCAALAYRLTGPVPVSRLCAKHLRGALRVLVAFESPQRACVLLVGPHDAADPGLDVYTELYGLLGIAPPEGTSRSKPPCCDDSGQPPPGLGDNLADLIVSAARQRRTRRR